MYDDAKSALTDCYQNLIYFQQYDPLELLNIAKRKQNHRISLIVPPKMKKSQITLYPLHRVESDKLKKTVSFEMPVKKEKLQSMMHGKYA